MSDSKEGSGTKTVGDCVGPVGSIDGGVVGTAVGRLVGRLVGILVGRLDDGLPVGIFVSPGLVGRDVTGILVGLHVG